MKHAINISNLSKYFGNEIIIKDLFLKIEQGKITTILGPNGSGKSTLLHIIAGLDNDFTGEVFTNTKKFSYIFQNYREALLPWRTNYQNLAFPLEIQNYSHDTIVNKIKQLSNWLDIKFSWHKYPYQLSGGQQQLLAFLRAIITNPDIILIDEGLSALDFENNLLLRNALQTYYLEFEPTIIIVTHTLDEAVQLSHNIVILSNNPTNLHTVITNNSDHPRSIDYLKTDNFHFLKDKVLTSFLECLT